MRTPRSRAVVVATSLPLLVGACGSSDSSASSSDDGIAVVASTNVYGDIAATIGGDAVSVTSVIEDPSADPHSYEASARTQLAVTEADLVIENGGGYDDFMDTLLDSSEARVINAVDVSGREAEAEPAGGEFNEHVWYDFASVEELAGAIVSELSEIDPPRADTYEANGDAFISRVRELTAAVDEARPATQGAGVAVTEPVPGYLLEALGAEDRTPEEFSEAIEEGDDVSPVALQETLDLFSDGQVRALVHNEQTTGPATEQVLQAAQDAGVAVVPVTETLPDGQDYVSWMRSNVDAVVAALSS